MFANYIWGMIAKNVVCISQHIHIADICFSISLKTQVSDWLYCVATSWITSEFALLLIVVTWPDYLPCHVQWTYTRYANHVTLTSVAHVSFHCESLLNSKEIPLMPNGQKEHKLPIRLQWLSVQSARQYFSRETRAEDKRDQVVV